MSTIPTTGVNIWCATSPYPWSGDPTFTNAWIADSRHMDSTGSVGTWSPHKGSISLTQATGPSKPTFSNAWGSANRGMLTFDGAASYLIGDALAAQVTSNGPWTIIASVQVLTISAFRELYSFSGSSDTVSYHVVQPDNSSPDKLWKAASVDNVGVGTVALESPTFGHVTTLKTVIGVQFIPSTSNHYKIWIDTSDTFAQITQTGSFGLQTLSRFTVGAFRGATTSAFANMRLRALIFAPSNPTINALLPSMKYLVSENS